MTQDNQDFEIYAGDDETPIVTVTNGSGGAIALSTATAIVWEANDRFGAVILTKSKSGGEITFQTDGNDGVIIIALGPTDTVPVLGTALSGWYSHSVTITDASGKISTVETGRMLVKNRALGD